MPISIISNQPATVAQRNMHVAAEKARISMTKISSGQRVYAAKEDASALVAGTGLRISLAAYKAAQSNVSQGVSTLQVTDGALAQVAEIFMRMSALANQSASDSLTNRERVGLDVEYQNMLQEIDRITTQTEFNGTKLLGGANVTELGSSGSNIDSSKGLVGFEFGPSVSNGDVFSVDYMASTQVMTVRNITQGKSQTIYVNTPQAGALTVYNFNSVGVKITLNSTFDDTTDITHSGANEEFDAVTSVTASATTLEFQVGQTTAAEDRIQLTLPLVNTTELGLAGTAVGSSAGALATITAVEAALQEVNQMRAYAGASMSRLEAMGQQIQTVTLNAETARSDLMDVDVASEMAFLSGQQALQEAAISMLTRANQMPQKLLDLLRS